MRNFKKFLALVLAMLMVSACAISVSAAADDAAVKASGYGPAAYGLAGLKVIVGDENGNLNPDDFLTRAEAAIILARLYSGADGWLIEWANGTSCIFPDVEKTWQFTAVNYVGDHRIMTGDDNGNFNPDNWLSVAEALTAVVKADKTSYLYFLNMDEAKEGSAWYTNWVLAARKNGLAAELLIANSEMGRPITRAEFFQIIWNLYNLDKNYVENEKTDNGIYKGFQLETVKGPMTYDADYVTVKESDEKVAKFTVAAFEQAMANFKIEGSYKDYTDGSVFTVSYKTGNYSTVYNLTVAAPAAQTALKVEKVAGKTDRLTLDGQVYFVGDATASTTFGIASEKEVKVELTFANGKVDTEKFSADKLPAYYEATATKKSNGDFDTLYIQEYAIGTAKADGTIKNTAELATVSGKDVAKYVITDMTATEEDARYSINNTTDALLANGKVRDMMFTGETMPLDNETPFLYCYKIDTNENKISVDVLEVAATAEGTVKALASGKYVKVLADGAEKTYNFAPAGTTNPADWTFEQSVKFFTIGGNYVKVAAASSEEVALYIDKVVASADKTYATVTGYTKDMTVKELKVVGYNNGKLRTAFAIASDFAFGDKTYTGAGEVSINTKSDAKGDTQVTFKEGHQYTFYVLNGVAYVKPDTKADDDALIGNIFGKPTEYAIAEIKDGKIKTAVKDEESQKVGPLTAKAYFKGKIYFANELKDEDKVSAYAQTYGSAETLATSTDVKLAFEKDDKNNTSLVWLDKKGTLKESSTPSEQYALLSGETIVYVENETALEVSYDAYKYKAVDLIAGKEIEVTCTSTLSEGNYYVAKNGVVDTAAYPDGGADLWFVSTDINRAQDLNDITYTAKQNYVIKTVKVNAAGTTTSYSAEFGKEKSLANFEATVYNLVEGKFERVKDADGNDTITLKKLEDIGESGKYKAFITGTTMYIVAPAIPPVQ